MFVNVFAPANNCFGGNNVTYTILCISHQQEIFACYMFGKYLFLKYLNLKSLVLWPHRGSENKL